mmetsp:Transcript_26075/g.84160  ORF Transcript_26075/g.84160 Transcript_26075/m.84160 type:complete len:212 (+) Transcript_26075:2266-2901(+)
MSQSTRRCATRSTSCRSGGGTAIHMRARHSSRRTCTTPTCRGTISLSAPRCTLGRTAARRCTSRDAPISRRRRPAARRSRMTPSSPKVGVSSRPLLRRGIRCSASVTAITASSGAEQRSGLSDCATTQAARPCASALSTGHRAMRAVGAAAAARPAAGARSSRGCARCSSPPLLRRVRRPSWAQSTTRASLRHFTAWLRTSSRVCTTACQS